MRDKQQVLMLELADAYQEQANDPQFQEEVAVWDITVGDGLNTSESPSPEG